MDDSIGRRNLKVKSWGRMVSVRSQSLPMIDNIPAFFDDARNGRKGTANKTASNPAISMKTDLVYVRSTKPPTADEDIHGKATSDSSGLCNFEALASESCRAKEIGLTLGQLELALRSMEKRLEAQIDVKLDWAVKQIQQSLRANHSIELVHKADQIKAVRRDGVDARQHHGESASMDGRLQVIDQRLTAVAHKLGVGDSVRACISDAMHTDQGLKAR